MKKIFVLLVACLCTMGAMAQENESENSFIMTRQDVVVDYLMSAQMMGSKVKPVGYVRLKVTNVSNDAGRHTTVDYDFDLLNMKKKPMSGVRSNIKQQLMVDNGVITFDNDPLMNAGAYKKSHDGFAFKIPATLNVGDKIETGTTVERAKFPMTKEVENVVRYDNFSVVGEEDIAIAGGNYHCYRIEGCLNGSFQTVKLENVRYAIWFSPQVGFVKIETDYYGSTLVLDGVSGVAGSNFQGTGL